MMSARRLLGTVAALVLLVPLAATANPNGNRPDNAGPQGGNGSQGGAPVYQVSGGGQVIASASDQGPGDTIAFVAQLTDEDTGAARGRLTVIDRTDGNGRDQEILHGRVTCVVPGDGSTARFGGTARDPRPEGRTIDFIVDVTDSSEQGSDLVYFREADVEDGESPCEDGEDAITTLRTATLARGNVTIHDRRGE
jgi:hypothetical protein